MATQTRKSRVAPRTPPGLTAPLCATVEIDANDTIGSIHPYVYGHFVEHLLRCVYGGVWTDDGLQLRQDTLALIKRLRPSIIRYPGGNFASGYHWEDGIGPLDKRPRRFDYAWKVWDTNHVGTDEYMVLCRETGCDPFLVVNDATGTPLEAARWVSYCNDGPATEQGRRRAANGHPQPYNVRMWGVGNEVWGPWQIGHTPDATKYVERLRCFVPVMRQADPSIRIVAVGNGPFTGRDGAAARRWNELVLAGAPDLIDYISFHIYQPSLGERLNWPDDEALHHVICAAPLDIERTIGEMTEQIAAFAPGCRIQVALDEWNVWTPPHREHEREHRVDYSVRDALYVAGVLNAMHRKCNEIGLANLAQIANVLPAISTDDTRAFATAIYYPFLMYLDMERVALRVRSDGPAYDSDPLGNIMAHPQTPYLDVTATRDEESRRMVVGVVNRHPSQPIETTFALRGAKGLKPIRAQALASPNRQAGNSFAAPDCVGVCDAPLPSVQGGHMACVFPPASVTVICLQAEG